MKLVQKIVCAHSKVSIDEFPDEFKDASDVDIQELIRLEVNNIPKKIKATIPEREWVSSETLAMVETFYIKCATTFIGYHRLPLNDFLGYVHENLGCLIRLGVSEFEQVAKEAKKRRVII
jgi:hypothetical protein